MHSSRTFRALTLVLLALFAFGPLSPAKAPAATTSQDYLPTPRHLVAARSAFQISAIAIGAAAGAIIGNILTGGMMTPILAGGLAAAAAAPTGAFVSGFLGTMAGSALGALAGRWVSMSPPEVSNQSP